MTTQRLRKLVLVVFFLLLPASSLAQIRTVTNRLIRSSCNFSPPTDEDFRTRFRDLSVKAMWLPQQAAMPIGSNFVLLSDDDITEATVRLVGREPALTNKTFAIVQVYTGSDYVDLVSRPGSPIGTDRTFSWRNYSPEDLQRRRQLCEEQASLLMMKITRDSNLRDALHQIDRLDLLAHELNSSSGPFGFNISPKDLEKMKQEIASRVDPSRAPKNTREAERRFRRISEISAEIAELNASYPLMTETLFYREFSLTDRLRAGSLNSGIRFVAADDRLIFSNTSRFTVRQAPAILTLIAQGGWCGPSLPFTQETSTAGCNTIGVSSERVSQDSTTENRDCEGMCSDCINVFEFFAKSLMDAGLANHIDGIHDDGNGLCNVVIQSEQGISNRVVLGKWKNTKEEGVCSTTQTFNDIIPDSNGLHLILLGQSHGGKKFVEMINKPKWGKYLDLDLLILWDATGPGGPVRRAGNKPKYVLNFFQQGSNDPDFQHGAHIDDADAEHNLSGCMNHHALARSVFVHETTRNLISQTITQIRNNARR